MKQTLEFKTKLIKLTLRFLALFLFIILSSFDSQAQCNCGDNKILNSDFEIYGLGSRSNWSSSPSSSFTTGTGFQQCGSSYNAFLNATSGNESFWQQVNGISSGDKYELKFYSGTHSPSYNHVVGLKFYNAAGNVIQTNQVQIDYDVDGQGGALKLYTITATAPSATSYLKVEGFANGDYIKLDKVCLQYICPTIGADFSGNTTICNGASTNVSIVGKNGKSPYTYQWSNNLGTGSSKTLNPTSNKTYTVTITDNVGCTGTEQVSINVNPTPVLNAGPDLNICNSQSVSLTVSAAGSGTAPYTYNWYQPSLGQGNSKTVSPTSTTTYKVSVTDAKGCTDTDDVVVSVNPTPNTIVTGNTSICLGQSTLLTASGGTSYSWSDGLGTGATKNLSPTTSKTYIVTVSDNIGCTNTSSITINVNQLPSANISGNNIICKGTSTVLTASGGDQYLWSQGLGNINVVSINPQVNTTYTVTVTNNQGCSSTANFEVIVEAKGIVGNYAWYDNNSNGLQDTFEFGINGINVSLFDAVTNDLVNTTITNTLNSKAGFYSFNICKGDYYIVFDTLPNLRRTINQTNIVVNHKDSDANSFTGKTQIFSISPNQTNNAVDAGYIPKGSIGNYIWLDKNANGLQEAGENGVEGAVVKLCYDHNGDSLPDGPVISSDTTDNNGFYLFANLSPTKYVVEFIKPIGSAFTSNDITGNVDTEDDSDANPFTGFSSIEIQNGNAKRNIDAGIVTLLSLGNLVWSDKNNNGLYDAGELPIKDVKINLWRDNDADGLADINTGISTTTNINGIYSFENLMPGNYVVQIDPINFEIGEVLEGYLTSNGNGIMIETNSNINNDDNGYDMGLSFGIVSRSITLSSQEEPINDGDNNNNTNLTVDFGFFKLSFIGNYVWEDSDFDGNQDANESGVNNVKVYLYRHNGILVDTMRTMSNPNAPSQQGYYIFEGLVPGDYFLKFDLPVNYFLTDANKVNQDYDSNVNHANGLNTTATITLSTENNLSIDAGIIKYATIGNFIWVDKNLPSSPSDGIQNADDTGINGVIVTLYKSNGTLVSQMPTQNNPLTNQHGWYLFDKVKPGSYYIGVAIPSDYVFIVPNAGNNDEIDSDIVNFINGTSLSLEITSGQRINDLDAGIKQEIALPVSLVSFEVEYSIENDANILSWVTASEINNDKFIILKSLDGVNFEEAYIKKGAGSSTVEQNYQLIDEKLQVGISTFYYQLKQVDFDGTTTLSDIVSVTRQNIDVNISIYPNPATQFVRVKTNSNIGALIEIKVLDSNGKLILKKCENLTSNDEEVEVDLNDIESGLYLIFTNINGNLSSQKFIKK